MRKKFAAVTAVLIFAVSLFCPAPLSAQENSYGFDLEVSANAFILVSYDTGAIIAQKNPDERVSPASTTKIMSVALAMELCDDLDGTVVTVPDGVWNEFEGMDISHADLKVGERLTMNQLLHCMMLQSANEAAVTLANHYGRAEFIRMMNEKAAELGCTGTHFSNPHGLYAEDHYTTASDMLKITQWALSVPGFWEMSQKATWEKPATNTSDAYLLYTTNLMQQPSNRYYTSYIKGIKTGTLEQSGRCLISAAQKDGVSYLLVLLGGSMTNLDLVWPDATSSYTETRRIYDWAFENLRIENVVETTTMVDEVPLRYASKRDTLLLYPDGELYAVIRADDDTKRDVRYEYDLPARVTAPVNAGDVIGTAAVYYGDRYIGDIDLVSHDTVERDNFVMVMDKISELLTSTVAKILYVLILLFVLVYVYYMLVVVPRAQKRRKKTKNSRPRGGS